MRYFHWFFFFLFLLLARSISAQKAKWIHPITGNFYQIDFETQTLLENNDGVHWKKIEDLSFEEIISKDLIFGNRSYQEIPIPGSSLSYLLVNCTGQVYQLDRKNWVLKRVDQTFFRGANCQSVKFLRNGVLYSFGGYGFWQSTNVLTKYDPKNKEWLSIGAYGDMPPAINDGISVYVPSKDIFVTMANLQVNDSRLYKSSVFNWDIYEFRFNKQEFTKVGTVHLEELKKYLEKELNRNILFNGRYIVLTDKSSVQVYRYDTMIIIDLLDGYKTYRWNNTRRLPIMTNNEDFTEQEMHFKGKDTLAWFSNFTSKNQVNKNLGQYSMSIKDVLADSEYLGKLTDEPWYIEFFKVVMLSSGILVAIFFMYIFGNLKRRRLKRNIKSVLGENEQKFLNFLLLNYNQGYVNGHQLIAFFGRHKSAPESQRQFRSKLIDNFTKSLSLVFQETKILDIHQDESDHRMLNYRLNSKMYKILSKL
jgi:hypothetical protein